MPHAALAPPYALIKAFVVPPEPTSYEADGEGHAYNKYYDQRFIHLHIPPTTRYRVRSRAHACRARP